MPSLTTTTNTATRIRDNTATTILAAPATGYLTTGNFRMSNYGTAASVVIEQVAGGVSWGLQVFDLPAITSGKPGCVSFSFNANVQPGQPFQATVIGTSPDVRIVVDYSVYGG